ncbi:MAG: hypothetical protein V4724_29590 [Pseudomonadota bacterium]
MDIVNRPTKEQVRAWLLERRQGQAELPDREQIRRELGWELIPAVRALPAPILQRGA